MKKILTVLAVAVLVVPIYADIITDGGSGALQMTLTFDESGNATLTNNTGLALSIDSIEIWSASSNLNPTGWYSLADAAAADPIAVMGSLGVGALSFGQFTANEDLVAEGSLSGSATFQPTVEWSIGQPIDPGTLAGDLSFYYTKPGVVGDKFLGEITFVPEPATLSIFGLGAAALICRRNK